MEKTESFASAVLLRHYKYFFHSSSLLNINFVLSVIKRKTKELFPDLWEHFERHDLRLSLIFTANILTMFISSCNSFDENHVLLDILDIFLVESWPGIIRVILLILKVNVIKIKKQYIFQYKPKIFIYSFNFCFFMKKY